MCVSSFSFACDGRVAGVSLFAVEDSYGAGACASLTPKVYTADIHGGVVE